MENLLQQQRTIIESILKIEANFKKDSDSRKSGTYIQKRLDALNAQWEVFNMNHGVLKKTDSDLDDDYFINDTYTTTKKRYEAIRDMLTNYEVKTAETGVPSRSDEFISQQRTNFRALSRVIKNINTKELTEKWEICDKLNSLQSRWKLIDELHWQIDNLTSGGDVGYEEEFSAYETLYETTKRDLNRKLNSVSQQHQQVPTIEIPSFSGNYTQWPTFMDLYCEAIHNNVMLTKTQKMQHLKGKLKGEAERIVQHLTVSADNYDTCWEILTHRYNNRQLLFTKHIQTLMGQPALQTQNAYELKKLHDTSVETIHAIHNLGIDTTTWDPILVHILTGKLDSDTYAAYMEIRKAPRELPSLDELINFLENKFTALEPVQKKRQTPNKSNNSTNKEATAQFKKDFNNTNRRSFLRAYHTSTEKNCPLCKNNHILLYCKSFQDMSPEDKMRSISQLHICRNCLYLHNDNKCNSNKRCRVCKEAHHTTLHDIYRKVEIAVSNNVIPSNKPHTSQQKANHVSGNYNEVLLATVQLKVMAADGSTVQLRCLLDQGSQINLITEDAAQRLGLQRQNRNATVSGIGTSAHHSNGTVRLDCESLYGGHSFTIEAMVMANMLSNLPNYTFKKQDWPHIQNIQLADPDFNISRPVDVLLDAGVYADIVMSGMLRGPTHAPMAQQTKVGWVLLGNIKTFNCHVLINLDDVSRFWEMEEITETNHNLTSEEEYCESIYSTTTTRKEDGRYAVRLPMKINYEQTLGTSKPQAIAQFRQLEKRLAKQETFSTSYKKFIDEYLQLGHMKPCTEHHKPSYFLPHHGVQKLDSTTTKLRVVFNASAKTSTGQSLNDLMECGPNLQQDLQSMILRWRAFQYVYTADIEKFYRQILIHDEDQHLQKIVWRDSATDLIKEYQLCTVTYGTKAAPFLAMRTIIQLVMDDGHRYPLAAEILTHQLYVDDLLGGSNDMLEAQDAQNQLIDLLKGGGFNLRKWASNHPRLLQTLPEHLISQNMFDFKDAESNKTLGLTWNPHTDQFTFKAPLSNTRDVTTKRTLLSDLSKLYDPLGWLSPVTMKAKLIFQQAWLASTNWDEPLPEDIQQEWTTFQQELPTINTIALQRWIGNTKQPIELHGFSDASEKAYGCVIYCKSISEEGQQIITLVAGKTKLAPLRKPPSLPRLELCGALLLSRLMKKVIESINSQIVTIHGWTDSMIVMGWLQGGPSRWTTFVANRVTQITVIMPSGCWRHVKSEYNPADCASRGLTPLQLANHHLWWGPIWLKDNDLPLQDQFHTTVEEKKVKQVCVSQRSMPLIGELLNKHSCMARVTRILSWILRFINNARDVNNAMRSSYLATSDLQNAHNAIIKAIQTNHFADDIAQLNKHHKVRITSSILNLNPFLDKHEILRVGGRLENANLSQEQKHPIILPYNDRLTELLIDQAHKRTLHGGARLTLSYLRNRYWIISGLRAVKKRLIRCITCHRFKTINNNQLMGDLPPPRVTPSRPFTHTGVDFTGHVEVKANKGRGIKTMKAYVAVFVCLCTKALHLELVSDLSTVAFLNALKRMCARRGKPRHIYSDNGTNFVGAARALEKQRKEALQCYINNDVITNMSEWGIEWHFNAPSWPTAGGLYEAAVKSLKHHLKRVLGDQKLTFEEFSTLLAQIEGCLNSRPLVALSENIEDLDCLTPAHFLIGEPSLESPLSAEGNDMTFSTRWQLTEKMYKDFWRRWSTDYLQTLQTRSKWHFPTKNLEVGDVVIVREDNIPPAKWILGRVLETHPGADGRVRVVTLKTKTSNMKRPITKLSRLPLDPSSYTTASSDVDTTKPAINTQRKRRNNNGKKHFNNFFCTLLLIFSMCVGPTTQQMINITRLSSSRVVYFDKVSDVQIIQDKWKMVVYYNMTTYWRSLDNIQNYVNHLNTLCKNEAAYLTISSQFQHELNEIQHYNDILRSEHGPSRRKRGLVNGIGYLANSLFGTLDERFANQYVKDINIIQSNENHLLNLYKNHTSIIESEYNLLKRNEEVMNTQFRIIDNHLAETEKRIQISHDNAMYITATALAVNLIISNIRQIQQQLLDLVTDVKDGRVDTHLIKPNQFEDQLNIISGHLPSELSLPCVNTRHCTRSLYKLARVHVRLTSAYIIFEVKLPLINNEQYELNRIIPIPQITGHTEKTIVLTSEYLAVNLKGDMIIPLENRDVSSCLNLQENKMLCAINQPIYNIKVADTLCEAQILNNGDLSTCRTRVLDCNDRWVRLHNRGAWLFSCCEDCTMRIFCPAGVTSQHLHGTGIMLLGLGCMLKGESFIIHARNDYHSELKLTGSEERMYMRESSLNHILTDFNHTFGPEDHKDALQELKNNIDKVKEQQQTLSVQSLTHDTHNYVLYTVVGFIIVAFIAWGTFRLKRRCQGCSVNLRDKPDPNNVEQPTQGHSSEHRVSDIDSVDAVIATAARKLNRGSSP